MANVYNNNELHFVCVIENDAVSHQQKNCFGMTVNL